MKIKKGDMVKVIAGKDINSEGKVIAVNRKDGTVLVEGVNMVTKHTKPSICLLYTSGTSSYKEGSSYNLKSYSQVQRFPRAVRAENS